MKFIGQYIQDFIARFRSDVYLEDVNSGTIASGGNLGLDSNNKIVKANEPTSHDAVTLAGTPDYITLSGQEITRNAIDLTADVTGSLPVNKGGTGAASLTDKAILLGNGTSAVESSVHLNYANLTQIGTDEDRLVIGDSNSTKVAVYGQGGVPLEIFVPFPPGNVSNTAGGDLNLKAGQSSGNAIGGSVKFFSSAAGSSGASINGSNEIASFDNAGNLQIDGNLTPAGFVLDGNTITGVDDSAEFTDDDAHIMTSAAINDRFAQINADTTGNATTATNLTASTSTAVSLGTIELGHADDTTIARSAAGKVTIESAPIQTTQMSVTNHAFALDANNSLYHYFPLNNLNESRPGDTAQYYVRLIAPYAGRVLRVVVRATADMGDCRIRLTKLSTSGQDPDGLRDEGTHVETTDVVDCSAINTTQTFNLTAAFAAGDVVNVGLLKGSTNTAFVTAAVVWEYTV